MSTVSASFVVDAVLFDMDGTLVDSIAAVESAWGKVAIDLGLDPEYVIAATHGKRAIDNLKQFKPHLEAHHMPVEVQAFEQMILDYADEFNNHKQKLDKRRGSYMSSVASSPRTLSPSSSVSGSSLSSRSSSTSGFSSSSRASPIVYRRPSEEDGARYESGWAPPRPPRSRQNALPEQGFLSLVAQKELEEDIESALDLEDDVIDRSIQILPGVRRMIDSIPDGRYAVATSGARTYAYGAMTRVGILPPPVTITADDARLKAGKPAPDPFLLAASCLGYDCGKCVVFEDSPSGIRAGVASGAIVVAVCTSHTREKIVDCGAHYCLEDMESIKCVVLEDGRLRFDIVGQ